MALNYHPQRNPALIQNEDDDDDDDDDDINRQCQYSTKDEIRAAKFAVIAEAYDVLSDPLNRTVYDQVGEKGLKKGIKGCSKPYVYHGEPLRTYRYIRYFDFKYILKKYNFKWFFDSNTYIIIPPISINFNSYNDYSLHFLFF